MGKNSTLKPAFACTRRYTQPSLTFPRFSSHAGHWIWPCPAWSAPIPALVLTSGSGGPAGGPSQPPHWGHPSTCEPHFSAFPGTLTGSEIKSGAARTQTNTSIWDPSVNRWWLNSSHNIDPQTYFEG